MSETLLAVISLACAAGALFVVWLRWQRTAKGLLGCVPVPLLVISGRGRILWANRHAQQLFAMTESSDENGRQRWRLASLFAAGSSEEIGSLVRRSITVNDLTMLARRTFTARAAAVGEFPVQLKLAKTRWSWRKVLLVAVVDTSSRSILTRAITDYGRQLLLAKQALKDRCSSFDNEVAARTCRLDESRRAAEEQNKSMLALLADVSHEFKTPLHGILGFARLGLRHCAERRDSKALEYFLQVEQCGNTLLAFVSDLLDRSRVDAMAESFDFRRVNLIDLARAVADEFRAAAAETSVHIGVECQSNEVLVAADALRLGQVFRNVLANAVRFSPQKGRITVHASVEGSTARIAVSDEGPGIPTESLSGIFSRYERVDCEQNGPHGAGLGLAICKEIVEAHQGRIWAENIPQGGAAIYITLPVMTARSSQPRSEGATDLFENRGLQHAADQQQLQNTGCR